MSIFRFFIAVVVVVLALIYAESGNAEAPSMMISETEVLIKVKPGYKTDFPEPSHVIGDSPSALGSAFTDWEVEACDHLFTFTFRKKLRQENPEAFARIVFDHLDRVCDLW